MPDGAARWCIDYRKSELSFLMRPFPDRHPAAIDHRVLYALVSSNPTTSTLINDQSNKAMEGGLSLDKTHGINIDCRQAQEAVGKFCLQLLMASNIVQ